MKLIGMPLEWRRETFAPFEQVKVKLVPNSQPCSKNWPLAMVVS